MHILDSMNFECDMNEKCNSWVKSLESVEMMKKLIFDVPVLIIFLIGKISNLSDSVNCCRKHDKIQAENGDILSIFFISCVSTT